MAGINRDNFVYHCSPYLFRLDIYVIKPQVSAVFSKQLCLYIHNLNFLRT